MPSLVYCVFINDTHFRGLHFEFDPRQCNINTLLIRSSVTNLHILGTLIYLSIQSVHSYRHQLMTRSNVRLFYTFKNPKLNPITDPLKYQQKVQGTRCPTLLYYVNLFLVMYIMFKNLKYIKQFLISNFVRTICAIYLIKWIHHYHNSTDFFLFQRSY